jgi:hypothetical protein
MNKIEVARELTNTLDHVSCGDCPLDDYCDKGHCLCEELESILKYESEGN